MKTTTATDGVSETAPFLATHRLDPLFRPRSVVYIGGRNIVRPLRYQRELGYAGQVWVVNPKHSRLDEYDCLPTVGDLPYAPDLAFVAVPREVAVESIAELRDMGCRAVICNAGGFAETGGAGVDLNAQLLHAAGDMPMLGPNVVGLVNFVDPMAAAMDHYGVLKNSTGVAIASQGGTLVLDAAYSDRSLPLTHLVGAGNQVLVGIEECVDYLLDDPRVTAVGLSFEALRDVGTLRRAAEKALRLGKPIVALKLGNSPAGARASASHTASMTGVGAVWEAVFDRLGIISTSSESEFLETLKLMDSGQLPKGPRTLVVNCSGTYSVLVSDHLSAAGLELPQPTGDRVERLRELLPTLATPGNPQDITGGIWDDEERQRETYSALLDEGYDVAIAVVSYPPSDLGQLDEFLVLPKALGEALKGTEVLGLQLSPLGDCFPLRAREHARSRGLVPMQGLDECMLALKHALWWRRRRADLSERDLSFEAGKVATSPFGIDEAAAKTMLLEAGVGVPEFIVSTPEAACGAADRIGYPVVIKALDARLLHKSEVGAVRVGLSSSRDVRSAIESMRTDMGLMAPHIPLDRVLVEAMSTDVVAEVMASITWHASIGPVMMIAGGGVEAELWNDNVLLAPPFTREEIERAVDRLKVTALVRGWRGRPSGDYGGLLTALENLGRFAMQTRPEEVEINPILVGRQSVVAVDAVLRFRLPIDELDGDSISQTG